MLCISPTVRSYVRTGPPGNTGDELPPVRVEELRRHLRGVERPGGRPHLIRRQDLRGTRPGVAAAVDPQEYHLGTRRAFVADVFGARPVTRAGHRHEIGRASCREGGEGAWAAGRV